MGSREYFENKEILDAKNTIVTKTEKSPAFRPSKGEDW